MKNQTHLPTVAFMICCLCSSLSVAQNQAQPSGPLALAAEALKKGDEARAWQLYTENQALFQKSWAEADDALVAWVPDQLRKQKRFKEALALCDEIINKPGSVEPKHMASVLLTKGDIFRDQGNFPAARMEYQGLDKDKALRDTEAGRKAKFRIVDILRSTRDYDTANEMLERFKDLPDPREQAEAYYYSALIAADREAYDEARELLEEVKKRAPDHVESLFLEAELNLKQDRLQDPELEIGSRVLTTFVVPGRPITMKMQDRNLAVVRAGAGLPVELKTSKTGDRELVVLSPSPRDPTLFRGQIMTKLGEATPTNMMLEITGADVITYNIEKSFQKANDLNYPDKKMLVVANADLSATAGEFISSDERDQILMQARVEALLEKEELKAYEKEQIRNTAVVRPGNDIRVQVIDFDRDVGPQEDTVMVDAETSSGDSVSGMMLTETNAHAGVFRGRIPTASAPPRALASDSAQGSEPGALIRSKGGGSWTSASDGKKPKWVEVDFMTIQPVTEALVELGEGAGGGVSRVTLMAGLGGNTGLQRVAGTKPTQEEIYGYLDLDRFFPRQSKTAAFVCAQIKSEAAADAVFKFGSAGGIICWLNGERIHKNLGTRMWKPEEDVVNAKLEAGENSLVIRVSVLTPPWGVSATVQDAATGKPLPSLKAYPPLKEGVVSEWYVFERLIPEDTIQMPKRITLNKPLRIGDETFRWAPSFVIPQAGLSIVGNQIKCAFHQPLSARTMRWVFEEFSGPAVSVKSISAKNRFGDVIVPTETDFSAATGNRTLELGPGDTIQIRYNDERNTRGAPQVLTAKMESGFHNATVSLNYETIEMDEQGRRKSVYDRAVRYRPGETESLVARVVDYDGDVSEQTDTVEILAATSSGEETRMKAIETEPHSGEFVAILRLGTQTGKDTLKIARDDRITVMYQDRENSDGRLEKSATVIPASDDPPELLLYQASVLMPEGTNTRPPMLKLSAPIKASNDLAVVTSMDTSLFFRVVYPFAALSEKSTFPAKLVTQREIEEAKKEGRDPKPVEAVMTMFNSTDAVFQAEVTLRTGDPKSYADEEDQEAAARARARRRAAGEPPETPKLYVKATDIIHVSVKALKGEETREGRFRLGSDAVARFMDRKYLREIQQVYAGDYLYLFLADRDRDLTDDLDSVQVSVSGQAGNANVTLTESLPHSGQFSGRIRTEMKGSGQQASGNEPVLPVVYGETITASYRDEISVISPDAPREVKALVKVYEGADGALVGFTKLFADEDMAVKTRLLTAEAMFELAKSHRESGQKELAEKEIAEGKAILEEAIADYPNTAHAPHAEFLLANLAQELEKYEEAVTRYDKVISNWPNSEFAPKAMLRKAICQEKVGDFENALDTYVELTYSYPNSPLVSDAVVRLGQYFYRTGKYEIAGKIFGNFQERNPAHELAAKTLFLSGQSYMKGAEERKKTTGGKYDPTALQWLNEGIERFNKLINTYEDKDLRAEAMYWLADSYMKVQDPKRAYQSFKKLTWDYPETKWAKFARGQLVQNAKVFERFETDAE